MRNLNLLNKHRRPHPLFGEMGDETCGCFKTSVGKTEFWAIASQEGGWEHVSISPAKKMRCPTWEEMTAIKNLFFEPDEIVLQYIMPESKNINIHKNCLHMWRPQNEKIPMPPTYMV